MPWDRGLEEVSIVVRVLFEPLWSSRPRAGVEKLDEDTGDRQGWMHGGGNSLELLQAGFPGAELVIPQVDDARCACGWRRAGGHLHSNVAGAAQGDRGWGTQGHQAWHIRGIRVAGGAGLGAGILLRERWRCRSQH